jgi:hypothetical protein
MVVEMDRSKDWLDQAEYDLRTAKQLSDSGSHAWSCFISQQAAEKALKSVLEEISASGGGLGLPSAQSLLRGHSISGCVLGRNSCRQVL